MLRRLLSVVGVLTVTAVIVAQSAYARRIAPPNTGAARLVQVDTVLVGRVIGFQNQDVKVQGVTYRVAIVSVSDYLKGKAKNKMVHIGFVPQKNNNQPKVPPIRIRPPIRANNPMQLSVGQHGLFFLNAHPKAKFLVGQRNGDFIASTTAEYKHKLTETKMSIKIGNNPLQALQAKDALERYYAAAMLVQKYRTPTGRGPFKLVQVDAKESKLILNALLNGEWTPSNRGNNQLHPWNIFNRLGLSTNDGWMNPRGAQNIQEYYDAAQAWLRKNANTYRVKKYVGQKGAKVPVPVPGIPGRPVGPGIPIPVPQPGILPVQPLPVNPALPIRRPGVKID